MARFAQVWIEPWCDEVSVPPRSSLSIEAVSPTTEEAIPPALEIDGDMLVVWASCPGTMSLAIDGVVQDTGSRTIDLPADLFDIPVKAFVGLIFGKVPQARPGGAPAPPKRSLWQRLHRRWRYDADTL